MQPMERDLNRVLADAMSSLPDEASYGSAPAAEQPQPGRVGQWVTQEKRDLRNARLGIDYSGQHLAIAELVRTRKGWVVQALRSEEFSVPMDAHALAAILREFQPESRMPIHLSLTSSRAVVRQFTIPPVPKRRRFAAATWEAQKLIPFPLRESEAAFGFSYSRDAKSGWNTTLAAVPRGDAAPILDAIQACGWTLEGVSVSGTQLAGCPPGNAAKPSPGPVAQVCWSRHRASFAVLHDNRAVFHYDMGNIAGIETLPGHAPSADQVRAWLRSLEKGIAEAMEFFLGAHTRLALARIELCGLSEAVAPLITDWSDRFEVPVIIRDPSQHLGCGLAPAAASWLNRHDGQFTMALLAAISTPTVDLTPASQVRKRNARLHERLAISAGALSMAVMLAMTGYALVHHRLMSANIAAGKAQLAEMQRSPVNEQLQASIQGAAGIAQLTAALDGSPANWSGMLKGLLHTFPDEARLMSLTLTRTAGATPGSIPDIRMEGRLLPTGLSHEMTLVEWVNDMEAITGSGTVRVSSVRELEWKGRFSTAFVIEITDAGHGAAGGSR